MGTTQRMARFINEARFEDIPTPVVNLAKLCLLDAVGCALYGTTRPLGKIFTGLVDELGGKPVAPGVFPHSDSRFSGDRRSCLPGLPRGDHDALVG